LSWQEPSSARVRGQIFARDVHGRKLRFAGYLGRSLWTDNAANRAEPNFRYVFEASTDLAQWTKLAVRTNLTGTVEYTSSTSASSQRFYRVVVP
jgi:hypothetical protein